MAAIFENRKIESKDLKYNLKFPGTAILTNLPLDCRNNLSRHKISGLEVKDDQGDTHWLTIKDQNGKRHICFTDVWKKFIDEKCIEVGDEISLYKDDECGSGAQCRIKLKKANKKRDP